MSEYDPRRMPTSDPDYPYAHLNPDAVWFCACGFEGKRMSLVAHRKSKNPVCKASPIALRHPGANVALARGDASELESFFAAAAAAKALKASKGAHVEDTAPEADAQPPDAPDGDEPPDEPPDDDTAQAAQYDDQDPEEVARRLNAQRASRYAGAPMLGLDQMYSPPPEGGDWIVQGPNGEPQISQGREVVVMPIFVRAMYDHFRQQGWNGTFAEFVVEALTDYFANCHNLVMIVTRRDEVEVG